MAEDQDWDLYAVVRSCTSAAAAATTNKNSSSSSENFESPFDQRLASLTFDGGGDEESSPFSFPNLACQPRNNNCLQELRDSCKPFLPGFTTSAGRLQVAKIKHNLHNSSAHHHPLVLPLVPGSTNHTISGPKKKKKQPEEADIACNSRDSR
ncbi:WRKY TRANSCRIPTION FACTOR 27-RELATED [Salix purpurea]|uniref:WRKY TRANSCRIPTION FACTOR 27-RELATED n=1 Tax=Salix purpurea TaxID=77065 RepID=A0A9Q1ACU7_SALPP|nr:WRKY TRANSCRIPTION FACTOR 27-RELATED [Salix purpurea]